MRSPLSLALAIALGTAGLHRPVQAAPSPNQLYEEGRKDYAEGRFEAAVTKLEQAYKLGKDPLMLYTIAQAYRDWGKATGELQRFRKAKETLEKFMVALQADPTLGDAAEIEPEIAELERKIAELAEPEPEPEPEPELAPPPVDPGKKLKIPGIVLIGLGGATFIAGAAVGTAFGLRCNANEAAPGCASKLDEIEGTRADGKSANTMTLVGWAALGGGGAVLAVVGGVLFAKGKKRTDAWKAEQGAQIRVLPAWGGLQVVGRF